jgi:hypothetical protein
MSHLSLQERIRIARLGFSAECASINKAHLAYRSRYAVSPHAFSSLPDSVHACEDYGRRAVHEMLGEERAS